MRLVFAVLLVSLGLMPAALSQENEFKLVVSKSNPQGSVRRQEVARLFLRKSSRWSDGREALPVDQWLRSATRQAFTKAILSVEGMSLISDVESYWLQQVYSGRGAPPPVKPNDDEVIAFVVANPGAVGYVSPKVDVTSVKVLTLEK
jgi:ABC-type phosphate transport system substrate-binding protein